MKTALVIGGGFGGCSAAHLIGQLGGWDVTLVEAAGFLGGGCKTMYMGGHPYTFGPRHFLTTKAHLFEYLNTYTPMRRCHEHEFWTYIEQDETFCNFPIHMDDIQQMPDRDKIMAELAAVPGAAAAKNLEEYWIASVGATLYEKYVKDYNKKMWMVDDNRQIDTFGWSAKGVTIKTGPKAVYDDRFSAYPYAFNGYDDYFGIATADATVLLNTRIESYDLPAKTVVLNGEARRFDVIVNTLPPDMVMDQAYGELPFIGRDFFPIVLPVEHAMPKDVYFCYYPNRHPVTRIVEYKKLTKHQAPTTLIGIEVPSMRGKLYPLPFQSQIDKAQRYIDAMPDGVFSIGRAGSYKYYVDIDDCIEQSMEIVEALKA